MQAFYVLNRTEVSQKLLRKNEGKMRMSIKCVKKCLLCPAVDRSTEGGASRLHSDRCSYSKTVKLIVVKVALGIFESCMEKLRLSSLRCKRRCFLPTNGAACRLSSEPHPQRTASLPETTPIHSSTCRQVASASERQLHGVASTNGTQFSSSL